MQVAATSPSEFNLLRVSAVTPLTDDSVCVEFDVPADLSDRYEYVQGQYVTVRTKLDGEEIRRSYSICASVKEKALKIGIKRVPEGKFSTFANDELAVGDELEVMPPQGEFHTPLELENAKDYLMIAAGSGITPVLSIAKTVLETEPESCVTLIYGNQQVSTIMFREELEALKNEYMQRFQLLHILSREARDTEILNGRINNKKGAELCQEILDLQRFDEFFLCGPEGMISEVSRGLRNGGVGEEKIHYELFGASAADAAAVVEKHHQRAKEHGGKVCDVTIVLGGRETKLELSADGENILDCGIDNGLDLPFACKGGVCATCKARVVKGDVDVDLNHALEQDEIAAGYILTCQAHPISNEVVVSFDE